MVEAPRTPPCPVDVTVLLPELAEYARTATRLHPRRGTPTARMSSIGGPMLWPAAEPWPTCATPWWFDSDSRTEEYRAHRTPNPLVPVLQLFAADAPTIRFPAGTDLLQVLWCPVTHKDLPGQTDAYAPAVTLIWRSSADLPTSPANPPPPIDYEEWSLPAPCVLHPEPVLEYPLELPDQLWDQIGEHEDLGWNGAGLNYADDLSVAPGTKAGGWPRWHAMDPFPMRCSECGHGLELLVSFDTDERGSDRWQPKALSNVDTAPDTITGLILGRGGDLQVYGCTADALHQPFVLVQE